MNSIALTFTFIASFYYQGGRKAKSCSTTAPTSYRLIVRRIVSLLLMLSSITASATEIRTNTAVLRWLDKVVARVSSFEIPVGQTLSIEGSTLRVTALACVTRPPSETPESAAFLDVWEVKIDEPAINVFRGWMFASSPALSAMEHPVYDLWLLSCRNNPETKR